MRKPATNPVPTASGARSNEAIPASPVARGLAALWWFTCHLPWLFVKYYGVRSAKKLSFRLFGRRAREARIHSPEARRMLDDFARDRIASSSSYIEAGEFAAIDALLDEEGIRERVRARKRALAGVPDADYFHDSQEPLCAQARERLFQHLPADFLPMLELARGRKLRLLSVAYHLTEPDDPAVRVGDSEYNAHPFHQDGNPKFAKVLIYLTDVGEGSGPFEMFVGSRFGLFDELLRLGYRSKQFKKRKEGIARWSRRRVPAWLRRETHLWDVDARTHERRHGPPVRVLGPKGTLAFFDGMNLHNGSRDQKELREVLHFVFI